MNSLDNNSISEIIKNLDFIDQIQFSQTAKDMNVDLSKYKETVINFMHICKEVKRLFSIYPSIPVHLYITLNNTTYLLLHNHSVFVYVNGRVLPTTFTHFKGTFKNQYNDANTYIANILFKEVGQASCVIDVLNNNSDEYTLKYIDIPEIQNPKADLTVVPGFKETQMNPVRVKKQSNDFYNVNRETLTQEKEEKIQPLKQFCENFIKAYNAINAPKTGGSMAKQNKFIKTTITLSTIFGRRCIYTFRKKDYIKNKSGDFVLYNKKNHLRA